MHVHDRGMLQSVHKLLLPGGGDMLQSGDRILLSLGTHVLLQYAERRLLSSRAIVL
jgi:hypothetical protein